jgi:putative transposase
MNTIKKCPKCSSESIKKDGFRETGNRGKIQRYECKLCSYRFTNNDGFKRMKHNPQKISLCLDLFYRGVSTRKIQEHLKAFYPHNADHRTILRWVVKYSNIISQFTDKLNLNVGNEIQLDEMEYKTKGKQSWFIDMIDTQTRFMVASDFVKSREKSKIKRMLQNTKQKTEDKIKVVTTDGFLLYREIVKKSFGYNLQEHKYNIEHNIVNASEGEGFNYKIERLHNSIRERTKTFRGFKNLESANAIMKGYAIFYNFIRKHQALGKCPYELATDLKLNSENKWLELIHLSQI